MKVRLEINLRNCLRLVLAVVLLWAAASKLANLQAFHANLVAYQLPVPGQLLRLTAVTLPWLELFCGVLLLAGNHRTALGWCLVLFSLFAAATGQAWVRGLAIHCGCLDFRWLGLAGSGNTPAVNLLESVAFAFLRALALLACVVYLLRSRPSPEPSQKLATPG